MFDKVSSDDLPLGMSVLTPSQFVAKEKYWAHLWSNEDLPDDDSYVVWSPLGRLVAREWWSAQH